MIEVSVSGNAMGLPPEEVEKLTPAACGERRAAAAGQLAAAGAHHIIDTIADLPDALAAIEGRLARGERP